MKIIPGVEEPMFDAAGDFFGRLRHTVAVEIALYRHKRNLLKRFMFR